jgi:hypothetical protein
MPTLDLDQVARDGQDRIEFSDTMRKLQAVVDRLYPGYKVVVMSPEPPPGDSDPPEPERVPEVNTVDFGSLSGARQMEVLLRMKPMNIQQLFEAMGARGATISRNTMQSTLSRKVDTFRNGLDGRWRVRDTPHGATNGTH